ncbi:SMC family ATPase [Nonomuraea sp. LPB2021202275-12-8]|uniref:SMC family ATPase n=1 Tax=Nonomuraea sp. LPB2021202275-12-8 TaxID=3120159 RepID=UPI00300DB804
MRPHRLSLTAFGSFPGSETVDFDSLAESGLFLVHGPTGAGKTTVLDALCFALYGQVPGQRNSARSLRCDHAPPAAGPSVTLEVTIRGRLLRIQRSPAWQRPKLRGTGHTEEKAKVIVEEWQGSAWQGLTTRADEAGDLVSGLLGMNADQFCQVAMLPQGDFARFLRADGADRRKLLERLFTVKIFTQAESWLAEHRKQAWREQQELRQQVDYAIRRLEEAAGDDLLASGVAAGVREVSAGAAESPVGGQEVSPGAPEGAAGDVSATADRPAAEEPTPEDDPVRWAGALLDAARSVVARTAEWHAQAEQAWRSAGVRFEQASALADRQRRHAEALTLRRTLDERAEERAELQAVLDDAGRADRVLPLIAAARQRAEASAKARTMAADALARARPLLTSEAAAPGGLPRAAEGHDRARPDGRRSGAFQTPVAGWVVPEGLAALERRRQTEIARLAELLTEEARLLVVRRDLRRVEEELASLAREDEAVGDRLAVLPGLIEEAGRELGQARLDAARIPAAQAVRDAAADLIGIDRELTRLAAELDGLAQREAEVAAAEAELPARVADATARLAEVRSEAANIPAAAARLDAARAVLDAARRRDALAAELESATATHQALVDRAQGLRERWLDLRQARIDGMAAELARDLADGRPCAVCGSAHHPHPASPAPSAPSADDEHDAERGHESALADREAAERTLATLESRLADATEATGGIDAHTAEAGVDQAERELAGFQAVAAREPALAAELERVEAERDRARDRARELGEALAAHRTHSTHLRAERARLVSRLAHAGAPGREAAFQDDGTSGQGSFGVAAHTPAVAEMSPENAPALLAAAEREVGRLKASAAREPVLAEEEARLRREHESAQEQARRVTARLAAGRTRQEELSGDATRLGARLDEARGDDATITARLSRLTDEAELLGEALEATQAAVAAEGERGKAAEAAEAAAWEAGFTDVADVEAAARSAAERESKAEALRRLDAQHAAVTSTLADPELVAAVAEPAPDLEALGAARDEAERAYTGLASALDRATGRQARLGELRGELVTCIDRWRPAAERHRLAERMAALASGTSNDNQWSMSLSSYVLGERLRQVVDAANERLDHMSGGRYLLRHDLAKTAGSRARSGGGLGLRVYDGWTGVERDPATLSGGESFITSLALALGLADVVTAEAGGAEIGTLFVDEGFGTLDEDTLDGVLDILDGLRDGGRTVGIVSHVAELRTRIPAQLKVTKARTGSTLSVVAG